MYKISVKEMVIELILIIIYALLNILFNLAGQVFIDYVYIKDSLSYIVIAGLIFIGIQILLSLFNLFRKKYIAHIEIKSLVFMKENILNKLFKIKKKNYDNLNYGKLASNYISDTDTIAFNQYQIFFEIINDLFVILVSLILTFVYNYLVGILLLFFLIATYFLNKIGIERQNKSNTKMKDANDLDNKTFKDMYQSFDLIKNNSDSDIFDLRLNENYKNYKKKNLAYLNQREALVKLNFFFKSLAIILICFLCGFLFFKDSLTIGKIVVIITVSGKSISSACYLYDELMSYLNMKNSKNRMNEFLKLEEESGDILIDSIKSIKSLDLSFSYDNSNLIINHLNFDIESNGFYGIMGNSGKGKSTLFKLILGQYDNDLMINGIDINLINKESLRKNISYLNQNNDFLNNVSLLDNLTLGCDFDSSYLNDLIDSLNLRNVVNRLSNGLNTLINDNVLFSGGEKKRFLLIRALLKKKDLYLLDEPEAGLNHELYETINKLLIEKSKTSMVIVITHSNEIILNATFLIQFD